MTFRNGREEEEEEEYEPRKTFLSRRGGATALPVPLFRYDHPPTHPPTYPPIFLQPFHPNNTTKQAVFSSEELTGGRFIVSGSASGKICVFDTLTGGDEEEGKAIEKLDFHQDCVRTCAFAPQHDLMVSAGWDGRMGLWRFEGKEEEE